MYELTNQLYKGNTLVENANNAYVEILNDENQLEKMLSGRKVLVSLSDEIVSIVKREFEKAIGS